MDLINTLFFINQRFCDFDVLIQATRYTHKKPMKNENDSITLTSYILIHNYF
ncbi:unnamed protein product [Tenebrio molitor]|nr:unnamed protein product [Tenebrio molitor]